MKKLIALLMLPFCLSGCGSEPKQAAVGSMHYTMQDLSDQYELIEKYNAIKDKDLLDRGYTAEELGKENGEAYIKKVKAVDVEKELSKLDDITDEVIRESKDLKIYRLAKDDSIMIKSNNGQLDIVGDVLKKTDEYESFVDEVTKRSGLVYNGTYLGKDYDADSYESDFAYTGRNIIAFANREFLLQSNLYHTEEKFKYNNVPMRAVFYMDGDKISFIYIYLVTGEKASLLTEQNLRELDFTEELGKTAAETAKKCFGAKKVISGAENGIKYKYNPNVCDSYNDMKCSLLVLEP